MADFGNTFERLELKYLITEDTADQIREAISPMCVPDSFNPEFGGYPLYNLYLDTPHYAFYKARNRQDQDRIKLRIRTYGPTGPAFLEVKRKIVSVISKTRVAVHRDRIEDAVSGFAEPKDPSPDARARLDLFAHFMAITGAEPKILVRYEREAHVSTIDRYARVTFDRAITAQRAIGYELMQLPGEHTYHLDESWRYDDLRSPIVLELKCETAVPVWLSNIIQRFELHRKGFSKYCFGVDSVVLDERRADVRFLSGAEYV